MKELKLLYCTHCKKIVEVVNDNKVPVICCGEPMKEIVPNSTEAAVEKHLPVISEENGVVKVTVSTVTHPMTSEHYITNIWLETNKAVYKKVLSPDLAPEAQFILAEGEKAVAAYEYCNLHGLWKAEA